MKLNLFNSFFILIVGNYISNESNDCKIKNPLEFLSKREPNKEYHQFLIKYCFSNGDRGQINNILDLKYFDYDLRFDNSNTLLFYTIDIGNIESILFITFDIFLYFRILFYNFKKRNGLTTVIISLVVKMQMLIKHSHFVYIKIIT